jgi:cell division protein FtsB
MIGLVVIFGALTACSANSYVEEELLQIRATLHRQETEIKELRSENQVLRADVDRLNVEVDRLRHGLDTAPSHDDEIPGNGIGKEMIQNKQFNIISESDLKRIRHTRASPEPIAFYAYMSANEPNPSLHHPLIFDVVKTNLGAGYDDFSGMFTAPSAGVYVFSWTVYTGLRGDTSFAVYVNHDIVGGTFGDTDEALDSDSDSGTMVVSLNARDHVYMRSSRTSSTNVLSMVYSLRTSFAGWKLN